SSDLFGLTAVGGKLFFVATDPTHGRELWKSDGTAAGTRLVRDIKPGSGSSDLFGLTAVGGKLFFTTTDPTHGYELWWSDGTAAGTQLVRDIYPGGGSSLDPYNPNPGVFVGLTDVGGRLFFAATDPTHGNELWKAV